MGWNEIYRQQTKGLLYTSQSTLLIPGDVVHTIKTLWVWSWLENNQTHNMVGFPSHLWLVS